MWRSDVLGALQTSQAGTVSVIVFYYFLFIFLVSIKKLYFSFSNHLKNVNTLTKISVLLKTNRILVSVNIKVNLIPIA